MYYEKKILPLDEKGSFLLAIHFSRYKVGGECTRESEQAYFAVGNIDSIDQLSDITSLCCFNRKPSKDEARKCEKVADVQKNMVGDEKCAWLYSYQAELALQEAQFVPRKVLTAQNGTFVIGIECDTAKGGLLAMQITIDAFNETVLYEIKEAKWPAGNAIAYPLALSCDGQSIISLDVTDPSNAVLCEHLTAKRKILSSRKKVRTYPEIAAMGQFKPRKGGWVAVDDEQIYTFDIDSPENNKVFKAPKKVFDWTLEAALESEVVAFSGDKGLISVVDTSTGKDKKYFPHRGCKRDDLAEVKLSDNGQWMASRLRTKSELMVTCLNDGTSWKVGDIKDQTIIERQEGNYRSESSIPAAFTFIGSRLLVSENNAVYELDIDDACSEGAFVSEQGKPGARVPLKISAKAGIEKIIKEAKLEKHKKELEGLYYPSLKLKSKKSKKNGWHLPDEKGAPILGESRFGGWPDLPEGIDWPTWDGRPMGFLAQLNLAEVSAVQPDIRLPKDGLLLFFVGCQDETYENENQDRQTYMLDIMVGSSAEQKDGWKVLFVEPDTAIDRTEYKGDIAPELFQPCLIRMTKGKVPLPHEQTIAYNCLTLDTNERDSFNEILDLLSEEEGENQLSGYPHLIQFTPPELYCANASSGADPFDFPPEDSEEFKLLEGSASDWGLLLQLTSDNNPDFLWGDGGHFYFYGIRAEMEVGNFENTWVYYEN